MKVFEDVIALTTRSGIVIFLLHQQSGDRHRELRLDSGGKLVALSTSHLRDAELRRLRVGAFDLQSSRGGIDDPDDRE